MKKLTVILASAAMLLGLASCNKETSTQNAEGEGNLQISFAFDGVGENTRYTPSTNKPTTAWANVKSLTLFLVDASTVKVALSVPSSAWTGNSSNVHTFPGVPAGNYTGYLVANYDQAGITAGFSGTTTGVNISSMLMNLVAMTTWPKDTTTETTAVAHEVPAEVFLAAQTGINVVADTNNDYSTSKPFALTRAISMMRVRINNHFKVTAAGGTEIDNFTVDFNHADAALRVRRIGTTLDIAGLVTPLAAAASKDDLIFSLGYRQGAPTSGYESNAEITNGEQEYWKDMFILPGGAKDNGTDLGKGKMNIVVSGMAPASYIPYGATTALGTPKLVHWDGTVNAVVTANNIIELNVDLTTLGKTDVPPVTETGSLKIGVSITPWGTIESINMPI